MVYFLFVLIWECVSCPWHRKLGAGNLLIQLIVKCEDFTSCNVFATFAKICVFFFKRNLGSLLIVFSYPLPKMFLKKFYFSKCLTIWVQFGISLGLESRLKRESLYMAQAPLLCQFFSSYLLIRNGFLYSKILLHQTGSPQNTPSTFPGYSLI